MSLEKYKENYRGIYSKRWHLSTVREKDREKNILELRATEVKTINGSLCCHGNLIQLRSQESHCLAISSHKKVQMLFRSIRIVWAEDAKKTVTELVMSLKN